ncbi:MAG: hypothetical protein HKN76_20995, partial [Saprospiraceae bacterium]|nr:hypothetical protein [Saprospiraceae bacterium]
MKALLCALSVDLVFSVVSANNIRVSNVILTNQDVVNNTYQIQFDVAWDNSWRTSNLESNYDAAWIFVKYRVDPQVNWLHGIISTSGFVAPAGSTIFVPLEAASQGYGAFLQRSSNGIGNVNYTGVQIQWQYATSFPDDAFVEVGVFAIEMVYIPGGSFFVGDGSPTPGANFSSGSVISPFNITSESALTLGGTPSSNLGNSNGVGFGGPMDDFNSSVIQTLPATFPKGFDPFFVMKYEISQCQYADFLNHISPAAGAARFPNFTGSNNFNIDDNGVPPNTYVTSTPDRACNYLSFADIAAYADWTALRPMSELEFEKICRGTRPALADEFAWGTPYIYNAVYAYLNSGQPNEMILNPPPGTGNALYTVTRGTPGPRRCGLAASSYPAPSRSEAGASYYG